MKQGEEGMSSKSVKPDAMGKKLCYSFILSISTTNTIGIFSTLEF